MEHLERRTLSLATSTASLSGDLALPYTTRALVVLVSACPPPDDAPSTTTLATALHDDGVATLQIDLLQSSECRFADAADHLPLLTERLLAVVGELHHQMALDALPAVPIGLVADGSTTPLAVRVAAQRDRDVKALACHGGLVDLAGRQYLQVLQAPFLFLADAADAAAIANAERAGEHLGTTFRIERLDGSDAVERASQATTRTLAWFACHLTG